MDVFVNFLLDYYIWILSVLSIIIVTIIGFLVDSKQKRKKKELELEKTNNVENTVGNLNTDNSLDNVPVVDAVSQTFSTVVDNVIGVDSLSAQESSLPSVEAVSSNMQTTQFEPGQVNIPVSPQPVNFSSYNQVVSPQPVNAVSITQPVQQSVYTQNSSVGLVNQNMVPSSVSNNQQFVQNGAINAVPNVQPVYQNVANNQTQVSNGSNAVNYVSANNLSNSIGNVQSVTSTIQEPAIQPQNLSNSVNNNMNFVLDVQQSSSSDDMWKL